MAALRRSLAETPQAEPAKAQKQKAEPEPAKAAAPQKGRKTAKRDPSQREMLLPIAGAKGAKDAKDAVEQPKPGAKKKAG